MGGILVQKISKVKIQPLPGNIPVSIKIDINKLYVNDFIRIQDIQDTDKYQILTNEYETIVRVAAQRAAQTVEGLEEGEEAEDGEEATDTEATSDDSDNKDADN